MPAARSSRHRLVPPCGYKGGKRRWSRQISEILLRDSPDRIYDVGAGSGAVSLSLVEAGFPADRLTLIEAGPWGGFWKAVTEGSLDITLVERLLLVERPVDPRRVKGWVEDLAAQGDLRPEVFLVLSAAAYGSVPVWHDGSGWRRGDAASSRGYSARGYWEPGPSSPESKPRGTIFAPRKILERTRAAMAALEGASVIHALEEEVSYLPGTIYTDPDYQGTSGYGWSINLERLLQRACGPVFCSEQTVRLCPDEVHRLGRRKRGAIRGNAKDAAEELLLQWKGP